VFLGDTSKEVYVNIPSLSLPFSVDLYQQALAVNAAIVGPTVSNRVCLLWMLDTL